MVIKHLAMSGAHRITFDVLSRSVSCRGDGPVTVFVSATVVVYRMQLYSRRELLGIMSIPGRRHRAVPVPILCAQPWHI